MFCIPSPLLSAVVMHQLSTSAFILQSYSVHHGHNADMLIDYSDSDGLFVLLTVQQ